MGKKEFSIKMEKQGVAVEEVEDASCVEEPYEVGGYFFRNDYYDHSEESGGK